MSLDWSRLRTLTTRELMNALVRDGFRLRWQTGSHRRYQHPDGRRVSVPFHGYGATFRPGILRNMVQNQARWSPDDLTRLGLYQPTLAATLLSSTLPTTAPLVRQHTALYVSPL